MTMTHERSIAYPPADATPANNNIPGTGISAGRLAFGWLCLLGVAVAFGYAGIEKIIEPRQFVIAIKNYRIVPESLLNAQALYLPWVEVLAALALLLPATRKGGAIVISAMLVMFICAVSYAALYKGYNINCGCFGEASGKAGLKTISLDFTLMFATWAGVHFLTRRGSASS
jgi:uncharacterized membrane protein